MTSPVVSLIMPAHNERGALRRVVTAVVEALAAWSHEIIIVDDGSTDGTWAEIVALQAQFPSVRGIRFTRNFGHQAALAAGLRATRGAAVITMDADGQHPPELLPSLIRSWEEGHLVVQALRLPSSDEGRLKAATSRLYYRLWSALSGVQIVRGAADFRLIDRTVLDTVLANKGSLTFLRGLIHWLGYQTHYVSFAPARRIGGEPSYTWRRMLSLSMDGLTAFSVVPLRIATVLGISVSAISFAYLCYVMLIWLYSNQVVTGWASTAGLVAFVGGIQLFTIGVLGEYIGRIFLRSMDRPQFVVAEVTRSIEAAANKPVSTREAHLSARLASTTSVAARRQGPLHVVPPGA
jgi:glycosyltransferase involved in cell wall biosynthesis